MQQANKVIPLERLQTAKQGQVLCYPKFEQQELEKRLKELQNLKVQALEFTGQRSVFDVPVLGKGCVGIVVVAHTKTGKAALKIRRIDADRKEMFHEGKMLKKANTLEVGPKLLQISENFLLMKLVEGPHFPEWLKGLQENVHPRVKSVLKNVLEQCYKLDEAGLDHGELSRAQKHIIVNAKDVPCLIDFETASTNRRTSNVTSVCQYFLLGSQIADQVKEKLGNVDEKELIKALRAYKQEQTKENFEKILKLVVSEN